MKNEFGIDAKAVVNRCLENPISKEELTQIRSKADLNSGLGTFARYLDSVISRQDKNMDRLKSSIQEVYKIPLLFQKNPGKDMIVRMSEVLPK
jgi:hypothetical protein